MLLQVSPMLTERFQFWRESNGIRPQGSSRRHLREQTIVARLANANLIFNAILEQGTLLRRTCNENVLSMSLVDSSERRYEQVEQNVSPQARQ